MTPEAGTGPDPARAPVQKHGGSVMAESEGSGQGSRPMVGLPVVTASDSLREGAALSETPERLRILVIEDNPDTREMLETALDLSGYAVISADSGEEALEREQEVHPDIILADIGLPGMDGYEFLRRTRDLPGMADVPALALTGFGQDSDIQCAQEAGFAGHLVKPVDLDALETRIRELAHAGEKAPPEPLPTAPAAST